MTNTVRVMAAGVLCALLACGGGEDEDEPVTAAPPQETPSEETPEEALALPEPVPLQEGETEGRVPPPAPTIVERSGLHLTRLLTTADLDGREPGEPRQVFSKHRDEKAYCYFTLENPDAEPTRLTVSWVDEEGETANVPSIIEVPAQRHFASYRYTNLAHRPVGEYACLIQNDGRAQIGRAPIRVEE